MADPMQFPARGALALLMNLRRFAGRPGTIGPSCTLERRGADDPTTVVYTLDTSTERRRLWGVLEAEDDRETFAVLVMPDPLVDVRGVAALVGWLPVGYTVRLLLTDGASECFQPFELAMKRPFVELCEHRESGSEVVEARSGALLLDTRGQVRERSVNISMIRTMLGVLHDSITAVVADGQTQGIARAPF